ncbi:MAG: outer membrane beta-barrel protein [Xanthomarina gelatinilytica]|uniref:TonB-dependent receptor n=1 Tax=Xanthomarina gelatinilytica TaxID=1137281 RepID=UPI003A8964C1
MKKHLLKEYISTLFVFIFLINVNAQELRSIKIHGKVLSQDNGLELAVVELLDVNNTRLTSSITSKDGTYVFERDIADSLLFLRVSYYGLKTVVQKVEIIDNNVIAIDIHLNEPNIESLDEVTLISGADVKHEVNKSVYKVRSKDYLKNAPTTEVLNNIPGLYYDEVNGILIKNQMEGKIFIDGMEASIKSYEALGISDIAKIEVITTPSARYGSEFTGGIINVITKTDSGNFIKGRLDGSIGLLRESYSFFPSISFKNKNLILKGLYSIMDNVQNIDYSLNRVSDDGTYNLWSNKNPNIIQQMGNFKSKYIISEKDIVFANFFLSKISEKAKQYGSSLTNSNTEETFVNEEESDFKRTDLNMVYQKIIGKNEFFVKGKIYWYERNNDFSLNIEDDLITQNTTSKLTELTGETYYDLNKKTLFQKPISYSLGVKFINRESNAQPSEADFNQKLFSAFAEYNFQITENFSNFISLLYETTKDESSIGLNRRYDNFLPTISFNKKFKNSSNLNYSFSKKIKRPGIYFLNDALVYINPGIANRGNSNLKPQKEYSQRLSLNKQIKKTSLILTGYYNYLDDVVAYNSKVEDNLLINYYDNIGNSQIIGADLSIRATIFTKINTNFSSGLQYSKYKFSTNTHNYINDGYSYSLTFSANTKMLKEKLSIAFNLNYKSPLYNLFTTTNENPYTSLRLSTNVFKDKLNISLSYADLFNMYSKTEIEFRNQNTFQNTIIDNRLSNIRIGISYNFGKTFNDFFRSNTIRNNDLMGD